MEVGTTRQAIAAPPQYRLNRRAALVLGGVFVAVSATAAYVCVSHLDGPRRLVYLRESAQGYLEQQKWNQAAIQLANIVRIAPNDVGAIFNLGIARLRAGEASEHDAQAAQTLRVGAIACFRQVAELDPNHLQAHQILLELAVRQGDWETARRLLPVVSKLAPKADLIAVCCELLPTRYPMQVAQANRRLAAGGHEVDVVALLAPCADEAPADFAVLGPLALGYTRLGRLVAREQLMLRAKEIVGESKRLDLVQAACAVEVGDWAGGWKLATAAATAAHVEPAARRLLVEIALARSAADGSASAFWHNRALDQCRLVLARTPSDVWAANNAAWLLGTCLGRPAEAVALSAPAVAADDADAVELLDTHGCNLLRLRRFDEAAATLARARRLAPQRTDLALNLARALRGAGRASEEHDLLAQLAADSLGQTTERAAHCLLARPLN